jgi:competence protein ComEA
MPDTDELRAVPARDANDPETLPDLLVRPRPPTSASERLVAWVVWFGATRLVLSGLAVAAVGIGGFWLVRTPNPAAEATLPVVDSSSPAVTLPTPDVAPMAPTGPADAMAGSTSSLPPTVFVHVAGEVALPGVYRVDGGGRVHDAIERAGGATTNADLDALNLAQPLADGQRLYVPRIGAVDPAEIPVLSPAGPAAEPTSTTLPGPIDVNRATAAELEALPGVGPATASAIVDDRERNGPFATVDDLDRVPGIGPAKLDALRDLVTV